MPTIAFTKARLPFGWLGNMSPYSVEYEGQRWPTAESLFQALRFDNPEIREQIRAAKSPMAAKFIAKNHKDQMVVVPRTAQDVANMAMVLRLKLAQHPHLEGELLGTGDRLIVEDSSCRHGESARFWGAALEDGQWVGRNVLGSLWMELRQELRQRSEGAGRQSHSPHRPSGKPVSNVWQRRSIPRTAGQAAIHDPQRRAAHDRRSIAEMLARPWKKNRHGPWTESF